MGCGCNEIDSDNPSGNTSCGSCNPCESSSVECESLPSALDNFTAHFFGTVAKSIVDGKVSWTLPCDLATGLQDNPRNSGEGLACYFLRLFQDGIIGLTGAKGDKGDKGEAGLNGYTFTSTAFVVPTSECPVTQFNIQDADVIPDGASIFVSGAGWFSIVSLSGDLVMAQLVQAVSPSGTSIPAGSFIAVTGPEGPQGVRGPKGDKGDNGDKGDKGNTGDAGTDGAAALTLTTAAFTQPAVFATVVVSVADTSFFLAGGEVYIVTGGYYRVEAKSSGSLTLRNLGVAGLNAAAATNIATGVKVVAAGVCPIVAATEITGAGTADFTANTVPAEIVFDTTPLEIVLPGPGTYRVVISLNIESNSPAPKYAAAQLYNKTGASLLGHPEYENFASVTASRGSIGINHRISVASATTLSIYAWTDANTADFISGQCSIDWMIVNPIN